MLATFGPSLASFGGLGLGCRVHARDTRRMLEVNPRRGGMKRLMEEAAARHVEAIHYSASAGIPVGGKAAKADTNPGC